MYDVKGEKGKSYMLSNLEMYLKALAGDAKWIYQGLVVEIDPTIDFTNSNVLVRWTDIYEGFNDKIIIHSLSEFKSNFSFLENA